MQKSKGTKLGQNLAEFGVDEIVSMLHQRAYATGCRENKGWLTAQVCPLAGRGVVCTSMDKAETT